MVEKRPRPGQALREAVEAGRTSSVAPVLSLTAIREDIRAALVAERRLIEEEEAAARRAERKRAARHLARRRRQEERRANPHPMLTRARLASLPGKKKLSREERLAMNSRLNLNVCCDCLQVKDLGHFYRCSRDANKNPTYRGRCTECMNKYVDGAPPQSAFDRMAKQSRQHAIARGIFFDKNITGEDLRELFVRQDGLCNYSGRALHVGVAGDGPVRHPGAKVPRRTWANPRRASIDRIDSALGYTKDNIHLVCAHINLAKADLKEEDFVAMCRAVVHVCDERGLPTRAPLAD
jgi:hypothetical protein